MNESLELRMYGLVAYQLSGIQQGIQYGHALQEYNNAIFELESDHKSGRLVVPEDLQSIWKFEQWRLKDKTFIILNGGTTNENELTLGSLQVHTNSLKENGIESYSFREPDLGDQMTATVFLVDERVFNKKKYPDFDVWVKEKYELDPTELYTSSYYTEWKGIIGGEKNIFLRDFVKQFRLA